jgi:hypothetical protein
MRQRPWAAYAIVFGVTALLFVSNAPVSRIPEGHPGGSASVVQLDGGANATRDCSSLGPDPGAESSGPISYNASAFWGELCVNETFGEILTAWGGWEWSYWILPNGQSGNYWAAQNLSTSLVPQPNSSSLHVVYLLDWVAPCDNSTLGPAGTYCTVWDQWIGNTTTLVLSGPHSSETPTCWSSCVGTGTFVTFQETGLPVGTVWKIYLNYTWWSVESQDQTFLLPPGKYYYEIGNVTGYSANPDVGYFYKPYNDFAGVTIHFGELPSSASPTPTVLGLPLGIAVVLLGTILGAATGVTGLILSLRQRMNRSPPARRKA